jgi:hypothetical protein
MPLHRYLTTSKEAEAFKSKVRAEGGRAEVIPPTSSQPEYEVEWSTEETMSSRPNARKHRRERSMQRKTERMSKAQWRTVRQTPGGLEGWHHNESASKRHAAILRRFHATSYQSTVASMVLERTRTENRAPGTSRVMDEDIHWFQRTYGPSEREY